MITIKKGNIFESNAQTLVITVNCVGVMGKGLALEFRKRYPDMFKTYESLCKTGKIKLGIPHFEQRMFPPSIVFFPTKDHWRSVSRLCDIEEGLKYLLNKYKEWGISSISVPPLGCGLGDLEWKIVGPTLYRYLKQMDIPVELYVPYEASEEEMTIEYLEGISEKISNTKSKLNPGLIAVVEIVSTIQSTAYHIPIGRTILQKITYFVTMIGLDTGLEYKRASFGPFSPELKKNLTKLVNNSLISERQQGNMFKIEPGSTYEAARKLYSDYLKENREKIDRVADLFCRLKSTYQAEIATTIHFAFHTMDKDEVTEQEILDEIMKWKKRHRPPLDEKDVAIMIRYLAALGWIKVKPSESISAKVGDELYV